MAGPSGRTARATTVARDGQENAGDVRNRQAGPSSAAGQTAEKEPEGPCPNRWACPARWTVVHDSAPLLMRSGSWNWKEVASWFTYKCLLEGALGLEDQGCLQQHTDLLQMGVIWPRRRMGRGWAGRRILRAGCASRRGAGGTQPLRARSGAWRPRSRGSARLQGRSQRREVTGHPEGCFSLF